MTEPEESIITRMEPASRLPYGVSRYYASLAREADPLRDPIAAQFIPTDAENTVKPYESTDPIADQQYMVSPRVVHHYHDRILILVNDRCATYCRHCFRRHFTGHDSGRISELELRGAADYLRATPRVQEVLLSGGDPLMLADSELATIICSLKVAVPERPLLFRLATRMPVTLPARITPALADMLLDATDRRIWVVTHANHPAELTAAFRQGAATLIDRGIPMLNQAVLLKGVNNSADVLESLFRTLIQCRVKPYYLFQGDLAAGTSHFRTSIEEGLDLMDELAIRLSGMALPCYAVDLPGGGGKVALTRASLIKIGETAYTIRDRQGRDHTYPRELG